MKPYNEPLDDKNIKIPEDELRNDDGKNSQIEIGTIYGNYKFTPVLVMEIVVENEPAQQDRYDFLDPGGDTRGELGD